MKECSPEIANLLPSGTMEIARASADLRKQGVDIISLSMGEPDFPTPQHIVDSAVEALRAGETHYAPSAGIPSLREVIANKSIEENKIPCSACDILVAPTKHAIFLATAALISHGDEILIPDPAWVSYAPQAQALGGRAISVPYAPNYRLDVDAMNERITQKTKAISINTPSNPLGAVATRDELKAVADLAIDNDLYVMSDEIYEKILYDGAEHVSIASFDGMAERTITFNGFSKAYAMTGWRLGWAVAPKSVFPQMLKVQQHTLTCVPPFIQIAGITALEGPTDPLKNMLAEFTERRKLILSLIDETPGLYCEPPGGAFYVFPKFDTCLSSSEVAKKILYDGHVAITPGSAFGNAGEGHLRISYAASRETITKGMEGIARVLGAL